MTIFVFGAATVRVPRLLHASLLSLVAATYEAANTHLARRLKFRQQWLFRVLQIAALLVPRLSL